MKIDEYISSLRDRNIIISVQEERIAVNAPDEAITPEIIQELKVKKEEILSFFKQIERAKGFESIPKANPSTYYPLSSAQRRMYFLYELDKNGTSYNMPGFYKIEGALNVVKLERAFKKLITRHKSLRTVFEIIDGHPFQRVLDKNCFEMEYNTIENNSIEENIKSFIRPFDLSQDFPFRASLLEVSNDRYVLMTDMHHIVSDGISQGIWMRDLWAFYEGKTLSDLSIQYVDYAVWQQSEDQQELVDSHKTFWMDTFAEEITAIELPMDNSRPLVNNYEGKVFSKSFDSTVSEKLQSFANSQGVTMYTLFLAIYNIFLSKVSGQEDIVVGITTAGRQHVDIKDTVGMFVNTLALRNQVDIQLSFRKFLSKVKENMLSAFDHQLYQYDELVDAMGLSRNMGRNPLFDVFFSYSEQESVQNFNHSKIKIDSYDAGHIVAKFDMELDVIQEAEKLTTYFTYNSSLFEEKTISQFARYFENIVFEILSNQNVVLSEIDILTKEERNQLISEFNNTKTDYDLEQSVLDMFVSKSISNPNTDALVLGKEKLTYQELHERSNRWAVNLRRLGVASGNIVGLAMNRSTEMITAILAIMKVGAAYLPINPDQPEDRTSHMLEEGECNVVLTNLSNVSDSLKKISNWIDTRKIDLMDCDEQLGDMHFPTSQDLAYIIYTSGSTGKPKGVMIQHGALSNLIQHQKEYFEITKDERILMFSPYYFDASIEQLWLALTEGATLILIEEDTLLDSNKLKVYLKDNKITHLDSTPSFLERIDIGDLPNLRRVVSGGEACKKSLAKRISNQYPFYNVYGPTEVTVTSTVHKIDEFYNEENKISIGHPIANTQAYVLDNQMNLLPIGVKGELYLGGKSLSLGYLKRPDLTKERFIENPYGEGLLYKTGDVVRWLNDGTLEYLGRNDDQVKIRGMRMELGEIVSQLEKIDEVDQALVLTHGAEGNEQLVAYIVGNGELSKDKIEVLLSEELPDYMIPQSYIWLEDFPMTPNGKVNKRVLPKPDFTLGEEYVPAKNENQQKLVEIWSEVLNIESEKISITSDFFRLGGHSLTAITLINKISEVFDVELPLRDMFSHRSIISLSEHLLKINKVNFVSIPNAPQQQYYPLSSAQRRMYFLHEFDKTATTYNMPSFYRVSKDLDVSQLERTFKNLAVRHESLRTVFEIVEGQPVQRILEDDSFELSIQKGIPSDIGSYIADFVRPFNLSEELPFRVSLIDILGEDYLLMIDTHHIINDGVSNEILMRDFWLLYHGDNLHELRIQYKDYALWQEGTTYQELALKHKAYWLDRYSDGFTTLELPTDYARPLERVNAGGVHVIDLDKLQTNNLRSLASSQGVTMYALFLSIYNVLLSKLSNQSDIIIGTPTAGRNHSDLDGIVGMFVNTLALRNEVDSQLTFKDFLANIQKDTITAFDHQLYPYEELVDALEVSRDTGRNPLFDVFFSYVQNNIFSAVGRDSELNIVSYEVPYDIAKFDLEIDVIDQGENLVIHINYNLSLFKEKTIKRFSEYLNRIISEILSDENIKISEIDILSKEKKNQILNQFNKPEVERNIEGTIVDLIQEQVLSTPEAIALYFNEITLEYGEINQKVIQLANYFIDVLKVKKGDQIGVHLGRSPEMIISFLAVLKSGAVYVALDPDNPSDRLNTIIENSEMKFILTNLQDDLTYDKPSIQIVELLTERAFINGMSCDNPSVSIKGNDPAYVIYTSGSTGKPKGVVIEHDSLLDYSITCKEYFSIKSSDKVIQQASPSFDTVIEEVFPALLSGAGVVIIPEGGKNIKSLVSGIKKTKATILSTVPAVIQALNEYADDLTDLRLIISGGDVLFPGYIDKLIDKYEIYNTYGPSESTVCITYHKIDSLENVSCIGKPIDNRQVYILNSENQLCPIGVTGELCVSGKGLAKEYLRDKELTQRKFVENPVSKGVRMYRTGDAAKWNDDGTIEFLGRIDNQVKIRGVRIEPGEIETQLERIDSVNQALVVTFGEENNKQLVAYLCGENKLNDNEIVSVLSSKLPQYMIPLSYVWLDNLPLNSNGKIDRKALPVPDLMVNEQYIAPENENHEKLVEIWSEVLGIDEEKISIVTDFFRLGGHSLSAMTMRNRINSDFGTELPLSEIFLTPTIRSLTEKIKKRETKDEIDNIVIPLNNSNSINNIFIIHDGSGEVDGYLELTTRIDEFKCYGIKFGQFNALKEAPSIKEIASNYINEIKRVQPIGPYNLLGWSLGGEIAVELTAQLENSGENVENLIIIDSMLNYEKPLKNIAFTIASELELLKSKFGLSYRNSDQFHFINDIWEKFSDSAFFKKLSVDEVRDALPDSIKQLIPDFLSKNKEELFAAANKIRLLIASSENHFMSTNIDARTLYIHPTDSDGYQNMEMLNQRFSNLDLKYVFGDHFSVMKTPIVTELVNIVSDHLEIRYIEDLQQV